MKKYFKNFYKYRFLFTEIVRKNIKLQYRNSVLGMFWTFLQPLLTMIVLAFIFGNIFCLTDFFKMIHCIPTSAL